MQLGLARRSFRVIPSASPIAIFWIYAAWAYEHAPHVDDMYKRVNGPVPVHRAESTAVYLFGFVAMATVAASIAAHLCCGISGRRDDRSPRQFGMAVIVMLIFGIDALLRIHWVRTLYAF